MSGKKMDTLIMQPCCNPCWVKVGLKIPCQSFAFLLSCKTGMWSSESKCVLIMILMDDLASICNSVLTEWDLYGK